MPVKIRLQRHGKKGKPFYWIIAADARAKRDGKYLEKIGIYNPNTNPATIDLDVDGAVRWLQNGAQPTDTARAILSYKGALLKNHLAGGVRKGALTEEQAEEKFQAWLEEKDNKINSKKEGLSKEQEAARKKALDAEKEANAKRESAAAEALAAEEAAAKAEETPAAVEPGNVEAQAEEQVDAKTAEQAETQEKKDA
ncbi:MAG: 30S ribosomal protein S16 [Gillisia sp.]